MMRSLIFSTIVTDSELIAAGIDAATSFAVDVDTPQTRPFLQIRWGKTDVGLSRTAVGRRTVVIWVHDEPGDYTKIDNILARIKELLPTLEGQSNGSGYVIAVEWTGDSEDLADDGHGTITRNTSYSLVGSGQ
jgi:hypothetical protein